MLSTRTVLSLGGFYTLASTIQTIPFNWSYRSKQLKQKSFLQKISFWLLTLWYIINAIYISVILIDSAFLRKETSTSLSDLTVNILFLTFYVTCSAAFTKTSYYAYELENLPGQLVKNSEALKKQFIPENYRRTKCQLDYFNWVIIQIINCSVFIWSFPIAFQFVLDPTNVRFGYGKSFASEIRKSKIYTIPNSPQGFLAVPSVFTDI
ncbi:unnamed protein product [Allacma fusca]|uniref:Uncharacterized protein n=1 Tax=Allacma fusca TaxID=39272 RepID=A0A8J2J4N0_9HEXA|nr:unnamed protein product [Allacma fusca]